VGGRGISWAFRRISAFGIRNCFLRRVGLPLRVYVVIPMLFLEQRSWSSFGARCECDLKWMCNSYQGFCGKEERRMGLD